MQYIPTKRDVSFYSQRVTLDGSDFLFEFEWNQRSGWYLGLRDRQGTLLFAPRKIVPSWDLFAAVRHLEGVPQGALVAVDLQGLGSHINFDDLSATSSEEGFDARCVLTYFTEEERLALTVDASQ